MNMIKKIFSFLKPIIQRALVINERTDLDRLGVVEFRLQNLRKYEINLNEIYNSLEINKLWKNSSLVMEKYGIPDGTGGINPGDRRAIFYLIAALKPKSVLEIGTHIGASTINIASSLLAISTGDEAKLITVDIRDVNSTEKKPWIEFGMKHSPKEMIDQLGFSSQVQFLTDTSIGYLEKTDEKFDFIFLDGDHSAKTVYQEISIALRRLNPNGVILLHDFFPNYQPLWSNASVVHGPFMAVDRILEEGVNVCARPLGALPWPTKLGSCVTSLALFLRQ